ncbi:hypothetical protein GGS20DRAFT_526551 [Poronia punctata]|nr:hypothetical protein GGS20DRAFT_526551 [Poronia punctata]
MSALEIFSRQIPIRERREKLALKPKPEHANDDTPTGQSLFSRRRDIINQMLSPTIKHFSFDGSSFNRRSISPFLRDYTSSESQTTTMSMSTTTTTDEFELEPIERLQQQQQTTKPKWDREQLLQLSDTVRASLNKNDNASTTPVPLSPFHAFKLHEFLVTALNDENTRNPTLDSDMIEYARLDKMVGELLQYNNESTTIQQARDLRKKWRNRFREHLFMMDRHRCAVLVGGGRLKDVAFDNSLEYDLGKWHTTTKLGGLVSEVEGNQSFEPGHWWLNTTCAERDGIINGSQEKPTKGRYGFTALPLLTGSEELTGGSTVKYVREGGMADMHIALISQVGRQIRVLRGYRLESILAPVAGLRYDGIYMVKQYGCKYDVKMGKYRLQLTLERKAGQRPFEEVRRVPKPSQLDDWALYEKLEGDKVKQMLGQTRYLGWKLRQQEEKVDREQWRRAKFFRASFSTGQERGHT